MLIPRPFDVWIKPISDPDTTPGGIIVPDMAKERVDQGVVQYVGGRTRWIKPGDYVLFSGYAGETVDLEGEGLFIAMSERQVLAIIGDIDWSVTPVPGLYFREQVRADKHQTEDLFFEATLETAMKLITDALAKTHEIRYSGREKMINYRPHPQTILDVQEDWDEMYEEGKDVREET